MSSLRIKIKFHFCTHQHFLNSHFIPDSATAIAKKSPVLARSSVWEKPGLYLTIIQCDECYNSMYGSRGEGINSGAGSRNREKHKEKVNMGFEL